VSDGNLELVRRLYRAFGQEDLDTIAEALSPDAEWHQITPVPDRGTYRGPEAIREFLSELLQVFNFRDIDIIMYIESGDHITVVGRTEVRSGLTGVPTRFAFAHVVKLRDGKIVWVYDCGGQERAPR